MPHVVNGIGTWYVGKRNIRTRRGTCNMCNATGDLSSFETTLFFVVFFLPLIPLGAKRINDQCAACKRHYVTPLQKWQELRDDTIAETSSKLDDSPESEEAALKAIEACATFDAKEEFLGIAASLPPAQHQNAAVLVSLADGYRHFGLGKEAAEMYRQASVIKPDRSVSLRLAAVLFRYGMLEEATRVAGTLLSECKAEDRWLLNLQVSALQAAGAHDKALALLDQFSAAHPGFLRDKPFLKMRKLSEKNQHTGKAVSSKLLNVREFKEADGSAGFRVARLVGPIVGVLLLSLYLSIAYFAGQKRRVYLVNGTSYKYEVSIGSQKFSTAPDSQRYITVPEGVYTISVNHPLHLIPDFQADLTTSFFLRPFQDPITIINPDSLALIQKCTATYSRNPPPNSYQIFTGKTVHDLGSIDCPFTSLPSTLSVKQGSSETRTSLELIPSTNVETLSLITHYMGPGHLPDRVINGIKFDPECEIYEMAAGLANPDDLEQVLEPLLKTRPVIVNVHRLHQDLCEERHPKIDLETEYQNLLQTDPKDSSLLYLRARILHDPKSKIDTYIKASAAATPQPYAIRTLSRLYLDGGDFESASRYADQMMKLSPQDPAAQQINRDILFARGKYEECLQTPQLQTDPASTTPSEAADKLTCLAALHKHDEAEAFIQSYAPATDPDANVLRFSMLSILAYCEGDLTAWKKYNQPGGVPSFDMLVHTRALPDAAKLLSKESPISDRLTLVLAAYLEKQSDLALAQLDLVINELSTSTFEDRLGAKWLAGTETPSELQLRYSAPRSVSRTTFLAVLGHRRPELASVCFPLATKLNFDLRYPHLLVEQSLSKR